jgi:DNA-binding CsgD family transcriptional regulator
MLVLSPTTCLKFDPRLQSADSDHPVLVAVLDRLDEGVILTDAAGRALFLNVRAREIVAEADGLDGVAAPLSAATPVATQRLRDAILRASTGAAEGRQLCLPRPSQRLPLLLTLLPVIPFDTVLSDASAPRVAIFIRDLDVPTAIDCIAIREIFHLTPRECDVAARLVRGLDLNEAAAELRIGRETVRSHLMQIYEKTGVHSQAALVGLLMRFRAR